MRNDFRPVPVSAGAKWRAALAKSLLALNAAVLLAMLWISARFVSYEYCHGAINEAHGAYCQTVYRSEFSAIDRD